MMNVNASFTRCATCTTPLSCDAYAMCVLKPRPLVKAHPAASLLDPGLQRVVDLTGADTDGFLPESPAAE